MKVKSAMLHPCCGEAPVFILFVPFGLKGLRDMLTIYCTSCATQMFVPTNNYNIDAICRLMCAWNVLVGGE